MLAPIKSSILSPTPVGVHRTSIHLVSQILIARYMARMSCFEALPDECADKVYRACDLQTRRNLLFSVPRARFRSHLTRATTTVQDPSKLDTNRFPNLQTVSFKKPVGAVANLRRRILFPHQANLSLLVLENVSLDFEDATNPFASMPHLQRLVLRNSDLAGWSVEETYQLACEAGLKEMEVEGYFRWSEFQDMFALQEAGCCGACYWDPIRLWAEVSLFC